MKISHDKANFFFLELAMNESLSRKGVHIISGLCWLFMLLVGAAIIGVGTANNYLTLSFCSDSETFCTRTLVINSTT